MRQKGVDRARTKCQDEFVDGWGKAFAAEAKRDILDRRAQLDGSNACNHRLLDRSE